MRMLSLSLAVLAVTSSAFAGRRAPDVSVSIAAPSGVSWDANARYTVTVTNVGNATVSSSTVTIELPRTSTSPTVYVLGELGAVDSRCARAGTTLRCTVTNLRANQSTPLWFELAVPYSVAPVALGASASTTGDTVASNDSASVTLALVSPALAVNAPRRTLVRHCTGTNLTSFYECELYPSSISEHETELHPDGTLDFVGEGAGLYFGNWSQPAGNRLAFTYNDGTDVVATFSGYSVNGCFEGRTTFPNSTYVSMYQVCLR